SAVSHDPLSFPQPRPPPRPPPFPTRRSSDLDRGALEPPPVDGEQERPDAHAVVVSWSCGLPARAARRDRPDLQAGHDAEAEGEAGREAEVEVVEEDEVGVPALRVPVPDTTLKVFGRSA